MKQSINDRIRSLCSQRNAVVLAHNYTLPEVQDIAHFVGDSLELAFRAAEADAEVIVFCGVHFMAETAKILKPEALVLMPDTEAGCPMADMATAEDLRRMRDAHPGCAVVSYVNTTAAVKAETDVCCTSSNAVAVIRSIPSTQKILFVPDRNLGSWAMGETGRELVLWDGFCPTHERILPGHVRRVIETHPDATLVAHPECTEAVRKLADRVASTSGMLKFCRESNNTKFIVATEEGLLHRLRSESPNKLFLEAGPSMICPNMKLATLEKLLWCLEDLAGEITVDPLIAAPARQAIERMLAVSSTRQKQ